MFSDENNEKKTIRDRIPSMSADCDRRNFHQIPSDLEVEAILTAVEHGRYKEVRMLIERNPNLVNAVDKDGCTLLHKACCDNKVNILEYLLQKGASVDAKTTDGWEPLHSACFWKSFDCVSMLISHGANINALNNARQTPLHITCNGRFNSPPSYQKEKR